MEEIGAGFTPFTSPMNASDAPDEDPLKSVQDDKDDKTCSVLTGNTSLLVTQFEGLKGSFGAGANSFEETVGNFIDDETFNEDDDNLSLPPPPPPRPAPVPPLLVASAPRSPQKSKSKTTTKSPCSVRATGDSCLMEKVADLREGEASTCHGAEEDICATLSSPAVSKPRTTILSTRIQEEVCIKDSLREEYSIGDDMQNMNTTVVKVHNLGENFDLIFASCSPEADDEDEYNSSGPGAEKFPQVSTSENDSDAFEDEYDSSGPVAVKLPQMSTSENDSDAFEDEYDSSGPAAVKLPQVSTSENDSDAFEDEYDSSGPVAVKLPQMSTSENDSDAFEDEYDSSGPAAVKLPQVSTSENDSDAFEDEYDSSGPGAEKIPQVSTSESQCSTTLNNSLGYISDISDDCFLDKRDKLQPRLPTTNNTVVGSAKVTKRAADVGVRRLLFFKKRLLWVLAFLLVLLMWILLGQLVNIKHGESGKPEYSSETVDATEHPTLVPAMNPTLIPAIIDVAAGPDSFVPNNKGNEDAFSEGVDPSVDPDTFDANDDAGDSKMSGVFDEEESATKDPTVSPVKMPSMQPIIKPNMSPTMSPTMNPTTLAPTSHPTTRAPTLNPTKSPKQGKTFPPTKSPTKKNRRTSSPTKSPTRKNRRTSSPTKSPTRKNRRTSSPTKPLTANGSNGTEEEAGSSQLQFAPGDLTRTKHGVLLSRGLDIRILATSEKRIAFDNGQKSDKPFILSPDAGATFPVRSSATKNAGGWVYVINSEVQGKKGGVGALTFNRKGKLIGYSELLRGTSMNCGGGKTPWNTWVSCEEQRRTRDGQIYEVDPFGEFTHETRLGGSGGGSFESFAYDVRDRDRPRFYVTEDHELGALRRFTPDRPDWDNPSSMLRRSGTMEYLVLSIGRCSWEPCEKGEPRGTYEWSTSKREGERSARRFFPGSEGIDVSGGEMFFISKQERRMIALDLDGNSWRSTSTENGRFDGKPDQIKRLAGDRDLLFMTEDGGEDAGVFSRDREGRMFTILESPLYEEETTGLAFSPDGMHMYMAYQKNGLVFDVWRRDGLPFDARVASLKYHKKVAGGFA